MTDKQRSWEKRLAAKPDELTVNYVESLSYDTRLYKYDIVGSIAHATMLAERKLITQTELKAIKSGLIEISEEIEAGRFRFDKATEDIHMAIEAALIERIGEPGKKLHTARSRNDQVATDVRLWLRDEIEGQQAAIVQLQQAFVQLAGKHDNDLMPAYTHLQRAQPIVIGAYLLSFVEQLERDFTRLTNCRNLLNVSPLGSGAIAGSTLAIDRISTARQLGFADIAYSSIDGISDRDFCAEFIFDCALIGAHLSRFAEDWILFSSNEFDFIRIDDAFCTSSSMMPQKRNPDVLELMRGKTGSLYGALGHTHDPQRPAIRLQPRLAGGQDPPVRRRRHGPRFAGDGPRRGGAHAIQDREDRIGSGRRVPRRHGAGGIPGGHGRSVPPGPRHRRGARVAVREERPAPVGRAAGNVPGALPADRRGRIWLSRGASRG